MHELAVTQNLLDIAVRHGEAAGARRILALHVVVGDLASIVDDCVQFYWDIVSRDTIAEGARLEFRRVAARMACTRCGHEYAPAADQPWCPDCQATDVRILSGDEFHLEAIDIESGEEPALASAEDGARP